MRFFFFLAVVALWAMTCAEPPVPKTFSGYDRGGYEIESGGAKTFPGPDQLPFPPGGEGPQGSPSAGVSRGRAESSQGAQETDGIQGEFPSGLGDQVDTQQQQRGSGRFDGTSGREGGEGEDSEGSLDDIPGVPGQDYPIYGQIPKTSFSCEQQSAPGYYADVEAQCQVFHICQKGGQKNSVLCPNGTIFNQKVFVCSWWYDFDCDSAPGLFALNEQVNAEGEQASGRGASGGNGGGGYSENGPSGSNGDSGNNGRDSSSAGGYSRRDSNREELIFDQGSSGYSDDGSALAALTHESGQGKPNSIDTEEFGGYKENRPGGSDRTQAGRSSNGNLGGSARNGGNSAGSQGGGGRRGSSRFPQGGRTSGNFAGYSENGPNGGVQNGNQNDLTTSGGSDPSLSGYPSARSGSSGRLAGSEEQGYPRGRGGNGGGSNGQGLEGGAQNGYPIDGVIDIGNGLLGGISTDAESIQYLPPTGGSNGNQNGAEGRNNDSSRSEDRSYLPPP